MKYAGVFLLMLILFSDAHAQCVQVLASGVATDLHAVDFWDAATGVSVGDSGVIRRTTDGGQTWSGMPSNTQKSLYALFTLNDGSFKAWVVGAGGVIRYTTDGGQQWAQQVSTVRSDLYGVAFGSPSTGIAVGDCGVILRTADGGQTWAQVASGTDQPLRAVVFRGNVAIAAGSNGVVCRSTDNGLTWTTTNIGNQPWNTATYAAPADLWIAGSASDALQSTDDGQQWTPYPTGGNGWYAMDFADAGQQGLLVGDNGAVFFSNNRGEQWEDRSNSSITTPLRGVTFTPTDSLTAYACGHNGVLLRIRLPVATAFTPRDTICVGDSLSLNGSGGSTYTWSGPLGFSAAGANTSLSGATPAMSGIYVLAATDAGGCADTASVRVTVSPPPVATAGAASTQLCRGQSLSLNASGGSQYKWSGPQGFTSDEQNPTLPDITLAQSGLYAVQATDANGCVGADTLNIVVNDLPVATVGATDSTLCAGDNLQLTATGGVAYAWSGPGGFSTGSQSPVRANVAVAMTGQYTVLVTDGNGCSNATSVDITVNPTPDAVAGALDTNLCAGDTLRLNASGGVAYTWSGPQGYTASTQDPALVNLTVDMAGLYIVQATDSNGCTDLDTLPVLVNPLPTAMAGAPDTSLCVGDDLQLTASGGVAYVWSGPKGYSASIQAPVRAAITADMAGPYAVQATDANGCVGADTLNIAVNNLPTATIGAADTTLCVGDNLQLTASGGVAYTWSGPGGYTAGIQNPVRAGVSVVMSGQYTAQATDANGCSDTAGISITVYPLPDAQVQAAQTSWCAGQTLLLSATGGANYDWFGPGGFAAFSTQTLTRPNATVDMSGAYAVQVTDVNGCRKSDTITLTIKPTPMATATPDTITCSEPIATLQGNADLPGSTFAWSGPGGFVLADSNGTTPIPGVYTLVVQLNGCADTTATLVALDTLHPVATATGGVIDCRTPFPILRGESSIPSSTFVWMFPNGLSFPLQNPPTNLPGLYILSVTAPNGCMGTDSVVVLEDLQQATVHVEGDQLLCPGQVTTLTADPGFETYNWSNGAEGQVIGPVGPGTYTVTATDAAGCVGITSIAITETPGPQAGLVPVGTTWTPGDTLRVCTGELAIFSASGGVLYRFFVNGAPTGPVDIDNSFGFKVNQPAVVSAYIQNGAGCTDSTMAGDGPGLEPVLVVPVPPLPPLQIDTAICRGASVSLGNQSFTESGTYTIVLPAQTGCDTTVILSLSVSDFIPRDSVVSICEGESFAFNGRLLDKSGLYRDTVPGPGCDTLVTLSLSVLNTPTRDLPDITLCKGQTIRIGDSLIAQSGFYRILKNNPLGCDTLLFVLVKEDALDMPAIPNVWLCDQITPVVLTANPSGCANCTFAWSTGETTPAINAVPDAIRPYTVTVTNTATGCTDTASAWVYYQPELLVEIDSAICEGTSVLFDGVFVTQTGEYSSTETSAAGCDSTTVLRLSVLDTESLIPADDTVFLSTGQREINLSVLANDQLAAGGQGRIQQTTDPVYGSVSVNADNTLRYRLIQTDFIGRDSFRYEVCYLHCPSICAEAGVYLVVQQSLSLLSELLPTAFSPNGDGTNDLWDPLRTYEEQGYPVPHEQASMAIVNRWGELVVLFDPYQPWDGKVSGQTVPAGTYYYVLQLDLEEPIAIKKPLTIIR